MISNTEYIIDFLEGNLSEQEHNEFELKLAQNEGLRKEYLLFKQVNSIMHSKLEIDDIKNDPSLKDLDSEVNIMVTDYQINKANYRSIEDFVSNSLSNNSDSEIEREIHQIKQEIDESGINKISNKWVKEWNNLKDNGTDTNSNINEIKSFVSTSLNSDDQQPEIKISINRKTPWHKTSMVRIIGLSAAALIVLLLVIRTFNYSAGNSDLFENYYKPFDAISIVTRNSNNSTISLYEDAIEKYKQGDYKSAASLFIKVIINDKEDPAPKFFLGISQIELQNYQLAIISLVEVIENNGDYKKEAQWYLGLTYLKIGELQKAKDCFEELTIKPGYYQNQAQDLFSRLK